MRYTSTRLKEYEYSFEEVLVESNEYKYSFEGVLALKTGTHADECESSTSFHIGNSDKYSYS